MNETKLNEQESKSKRQGSWKYLRRIREELQHRARVYNLKHDIRVTGDSETTISYIAADKTCEFGALAFGGGVMLSSAVPVGIITGNKVLFDVGMTGVVLALSGFVSFSIGIIVLDRIKSW